MIREELVKWGAKCNREVSTLLIAAWEEDLQTYPIEALRAAFVRLRQTKKIGFPLPGEVIALMEAANNTADDLSAEREWSALISGLNFGDPPKLSAVGEHAAKCAGGFQWLSDCPQEELTWRKREFLKAYTQAKSVATLVDLGPNEHTRRILAEASEQMGRPRLVKTLPPVPAERRSAADMAREDREREAREALEGNPALREILNPKKRGASSSRDAVGG